MKKLIIFDWDDVFTLGSTAGYYKCYHEALLDVGVIISATEEKKRIATKWGSSHQEEIKELLKERPELVEQAVSAYEKHYFGRTFIECLSILPNTNKLLTELSKNYILALATGIHPKMLKEKIIPKFEIPDVFAEIITAHDIDKPENTKPNPYSAKLIMDRINVDPIDTIMVGDAKNDVLMAQAADIEPIVVLTGHLTKAEAQKLGVKHILDDVTHLPLHSTPKCTTNQKHLCTSLN
jgi:phosphoglycolate phosphatase-like HAD superfamily hydrolase